MTRKIDYGKLMHEAMRGLIQTVLEDVRDNGLPGAHHFFITFETTHPEAQLADWLKERYPSEMTVVMQHWFDDLEVTRDGFSVTLNFGDAPEHLYIPFDAVQTFVDPSVEFGLRFESVEEGEDDEEFAPEHADAPQDAPMQENAEDAPAQKEADVVSLDQFRKT
jgi:hypothetical protein